MYSIILSRENTCTGKKNTVIKKKNYAIFVLYLSKETMEGLESVNLMSSRQLLLKTP